MRSPKARLPIWSWFCRKSTNAVARQSSRWARRAPRRRGAATVRPGRRSPRPARAAQVLRGRVGVVAVVAVALAGEQHVEGVVRVVVPLRVVAVEQARHVGVVLEHQVDVAVRLDRRAHPRRQLVEERPRRVVANLVHRVEAQAVEAVLAQPVQRVLDEELAHGAGALAVDVDRRAPRRVVALGEEVAREQVQVVALGAEVVVHARRAARSGSRACAASTSALSSSGEP